jgi:hypothetical protein
MTAIFNPTIDRPFGFPKGFFCAYAGGGQDVIFSFHFVDIIVKSCPSLALNWV